MSDFSFAIIGAGLAGCECAWQLAKAGHAVTIFEQKPVCRPEAHVSDMFAELVCSNSFRSADPDSAIGMLKDELRQLDSLFMHAADFCRIPAGKALAVDREKFSSFITNAILNEPRIKVINRPVCSIHDPDLADADRVVIAAGPLASESLANSLAEIIGQEHCYFYDAIAPIVWTSSINMEIAFRGSRYGSGESTQGDYLNCPMDRDEYDRFYNELLNARVAPVREPEKEKHFEGCMPLEALAARGPKTLVFGPMKPVGFVDPRTGKRPWAILQLRAENANNETCNLVGCQTKLLQPEQERIFRLIPGLEKAEFARYGSMHRNTYVNAPKVLDENLAIRNMPRMFLAGQITGVEGYVESAASGLWLGISLAARNSGKYIGKPPVESALGSLLAHLQRPVKNFQPSNANYGLTPELAGRTRKAERKQEYSARGRLAFANWLRNIGRL